MIEPEIVDYSKNAGKDTAVFDKSAFTGGNTKKMITREFLKKYVSFIKS